MTLAQLYRTVYREANAEARVPITRLSVLRHLERWARGRKDYDPAITGAALMALDQD